MSRKMAGGAPNLNGRQHPNPSEIHGEHGVSKRKSLSAAVTARNQTILHTSLCPVPGEPFPEAPSAFGPLTLEAQKSAKYKRRQSAFAKTAFHHEGFEDYVQMRALLEIKAESERHDNALNKVALYTAKETMLPLALVHKEVTPVPRKAAVPGGRKAEYWVPTERKTFRRAMAGGAPNLNGRQHPRPTVLHGEHGLSKRHSVHQHMAARNSIILKNTLSPIPGEKFPRRNSDPGILTLLAMKSTAYKRRQAKFAKTSYDPII